MHRDIISGCRVYQSTKPKCIYIYYENFSHFYCKMTSLNNSIWITHEGQELERLNVQNTRHRAGINNHFRRNIPIVFFAKNDDPEYWKGMLNDSISKTAAAKLCLAVQLPGGQNLYVHRIIKTNIIENRLTFRFVVESKSRIHFFVADTISQQNSCNHYNLLSRDNVL